MCLYEGCFTQMVYEHFHATNIIFKVSKDTNNGQHWGEILLFKNVVFCANGSCCRRRRPPRRPAVVSGVTARFLAPFQFDCHQLLKRLLRSPCQLQRHFVDLP